MSRAAFSAWDSTRLRRVPRICVGATGKARLARELALAQETVAEQLAAAQEAVTGLPTALQDVRRSHRHGTRPWIIAGAATAVLAGGAVAFSFVRRSSRPEPSPRPPSVDVQPQP